MLRTLFFVLAGIVILAVPVVFLLSRLPQKPRKASRVLAFFAPIVVNGFFILWVAALYTGTLWLMYDTGDLVTAGMGGADCADHRGRRAHRLCGEVAQNAQAC